MIAYQGSYLYAKSLMSNPRMHNQQYAVYSMLSDVKVAHILWITDTWKLLSVPGVQWQADTLREAADCLHVVILMEQLKDIPESFR